MANHLSANDLERYRRRVMPPGELIAADDHLITCEDCRERFDEDAHIEAAYAFARTSLQVAEAASQTHLRYEQMVAYMDDRLDTKDRVNMESHLEVCSPCRNELKDLNDLKSELDFEKEFAPAIRPSFSGRVVAFGRSHGFKIAAAIAVVLFGLTLWVFMRAQAKNLESQIQKANESLQRQTSTIAEMQARLSHIQEENKTLEQDLRTSEAEVSDLQTQLARKQRPGASSLSGASGSSVLSLRDGDRIVRLDGQGNVEGVESLSPAHRQMVETLLATGRLKTPSGLSELVGQSRQLMGSVQTAGAFALLKPLSTVVRTDRPTLRWRPLDGATSYTVGIYRSDFIEAASSGPLTTTEWTLPQPLERGVVYTWQVRAIKDGKEIRLPLPSDPQAKFKVLDQSKAEELERAERSYSKSHLIMGALYAQAGLLDDAEREFQTLLDANPGSRAVRQLLDNLKALRPK